METKIKEEPDEATECTSHEFIDVDSIKIEECNLEYLKEEENLENEQRKCSGKRRFCKTKNLANRIYCCYSCDCKLWDVINSRARSERKEVYICPTCERQFSREETLAKHVQVHSRVFVCPTCEKSYKSSTSLQRHKFSHSGEKRYHCTKCDYKCSHSNSLKTHFMTHTQEKPHQCEQCGYKCSVKQRLKEHMRTHTGEKPYFCTLCKFQTSLKKCLKKSHEHSHW